MVEYVYFIQAGTDGLIKIGYSSDPKRRLANLQSPVPLRLLATMRGGRKLERRLHKKLAAHRKHGEWFEPHRDVLAIIENAIEVESRKPQSNDCEFSSDVASRNLAELFMSEGKAGDAARALRSSFNRTGVIDGTLLRNLATAMGIDVAEAATA